MPTHSEAVYTACISPLQDDRIKFNQTDWFNLLRICLVCPCHKLYRVNFANCEIWGKYVKIWYFANICLVKVRIPKSFWACEQTLMICRTSYFISTKSKNRKIQISFLTCVFYKLHPALLKDRFLKKMLNMSKNL